MRGRDGLCWRCGTLKAEKSYRIKFRVPSDVAEVLDAQKDRPGYVARAVTWYARFGEPCMQKLDSLLKLVRGGAGPPGKRGPGDDGEERLIDDAFSEFVL